jgi:hypothetical protein
MNKITSCSALVVSNIVKWVDPTDQSIILHIYPLANLRVV